jgi:hypothetical protein
MAARALSRSGGVRAAEINSSRNLFSRPHHGNRGKTSRSGKKRPFRAATPAAGSIGRLFLRAGTESGRVFYFYCSAQSIKKRTARFTAALKCAPLHLLWSGNLTTTLFKWPNLPRNSISRRGKRFLGNCFHVNPRTLLELLNSLEFFVDDYVLFNNID